MQHKNKTAQPVHTPSTTITHNLSSSVKSLPAVQCFAETKDDKQNEDKTAVKETAIDDRYDRSSAGEIKPFQLKKNNTGLPDSLKSGIEDLSGFAMDDVKVHYNSDKPSQLQALAYAQGSDIHIAPGQERHLPHEAWHVVQQKQGRVQATRQMKSGIGVNDDLGLEREADNMGNKAAMMKKEMPENKPVPGNLKTAWLPAFSPVQRMKAEQLTEKHIDKWFAVHLSPGEKPRVGKYFKKDEANFYWFSENLPDGGERQFAVQGGNKVVLMPHFHKTLPPAEDNSNSKQEVDMETDVPVLPAASIIPASAVIPPKKLVIDAGSKSGTVQLPEEQLGLTDPYSFSAQQFFKQLQIETDRVVLMIMDQINNWSLIQEKYINEATTILMSAKALHMAHQDTAEQLKGSKATILPITATDEVWDESTVRDWNKERAHLHIKSIMLHDLESGSLITIWGSGNWTQSGLFKNAEFTIVDRRPSAARAELLALDSYCSFLDIKKQQESAKLVLLGKTIKELLMSTSPLPDEGMDQRTKAGATVEGFLKAEYDSVSKNNKSPFRSALMQLKHYYMVSDDTMALYTLPSIYTFTNSGGEQKKTIDMKILTGHIGFLIKSMLNTAEKSITISSMTMFTAGNDVVLQKMLDLLEEDAKQLEVKLLVGKEGSEKLIDVLKSKNVTFTTHIAGKPDQEEKGTSRPIEVYIFSNKEGDQREHWAFHSKIMVIDEKAALLTSANFIFSNSRGGGGNALNKYYYTKDTSMVKIAKQYLGGYMNSTK